MPIPDENGFISIQVRPFLSPDFSTQIEQLP